LGDGTNYSKIRLEEFLAQHEVALGRGNAAGLGGRLPVQPDQLPRDDQNRKYLIVSAVHQLESDEYESFSGARDFRQALSGRNHRHRRATAVSGAARHPQAGGARTADRRRGRPGRARKFTPISTLG
jgi:uncharacterized protein involved in type VI secretion and phage assembly